ncbi:hypothetical protein niasHS_011858 [Heterodera schachtii]|uniref:Uncharacterized protein n=1 Tax=Heterodera schachtii TaxID=97005 RepID=A0ABD2IZW8_HETSC
MYRIRPYFPDFPVQPEHILYRLSCHHAIPENSVNAEQSNSTASPHIKITDKQKRDNEQQHNMNAVDDEFVSRLLKVSSRLDNLINVFGKKSSIKLKEDENDNNKLHSNSPNVVHALIGPTSCAVFPIHDYGETFRKKYFGEILQCNLRSSDRILFDILKKIGDGRKVSFTCDSSSVAENSRVIIKLNLESNEISILRKDQSKIEGDISVWKFIGSLVGIYCADDQSVNELADHWLSLASSAVQIDDLSRRMSVHLGAHDFLSSQHAICLADLVLRCCFFDTKTTDLLNWSSIKASNNVQLWAKRVDDAFANI